MQKKEEKNREGYVVKFESGYRVKVKFAEYMRLHKLLTCITERSIWMELREGRSLQSMIELVPDEFFNWVKTIEKKLVDKFENIEMESKSIVDEALKTCQTRKDMAGLILSATKINRASNVCFQMLDGKDYKEAIWKLIKPDALKPFNDAEQNE